MVERRERGASDDDGPPTMGGSGCTGEGSPHPHCQQKTTVVSTTQTLTRDCSNSAFGS